MREFAIALLLMLLVAKVVIAQTHSLIIEQKARQMEFRLMPSLQLADEPLIQYRLEDRTKSHHVTALYMELMRSITHLYNWHDFKSIIKKMVRLPAEKLAPMVRNYTLPNRPDRVLQITAEANYLWVKQLWNNMEYTLCPESNLDLFVKEYGDWFTFESAFDDLITSVTHGESKWIKMK